MKRIVAVLLFACLSASVFAQSPMVDEQPIRASRRSAAWCVKAVETCWDSKQGKFRDEERVAAKTAYDQAKATYQKILRESVAD